VGDGGDDLVQPGVGQSRDDQTGRVDDAVVVSRGLVGHLFLGQPLDLALQVRRIVADDHVQEPEALAADGHNPEAAVGLGAHSLDASGTADVVEGRGGGDLLDLPALANGHDAEEALVAGLRQRQQVVHQPAVARLEDLQRQDDAGKEGRPEREQRDQLAHPASVRVPSCRRPSAVYP